MKPKEKWEWAHAGWKKNLGQEWSAEHGKTLTVYWRNGIKWGADSDQKCLWYEKDSDSEDSEESEEIE